MLTAPAAPKPSTPSTMLTCCLISILLPAEDTRHLSHTWATAFLQTQHHRPKYPAASQRAHTGSGHLFCASADTSFICHHWSGWHPLVGASMVWHPGQICSLPPLLGQSPHRAGGQEERGKDSGCRLFLCPAVTRSQPHQAHTHTNPAQAQHHLWHSTGQPSCSQRLWAWDGADALSQGPREGSSRERC